MSSAGIPGYQALGEDINKVKESSSETKEGIVSDALAELSLDTSDEELVALADKWDKSWRSYGGKIKSRQENNEKAWLGQTKNPLDTNAQVDEKPTADNIIFEATETLLPMMTRQAPEPSVEADNSEEGNALAYRVGKFLIHLSKILNMKITMKSVARNWMLYFLGVGKVGWSDKDQEISFVSIRPQRLILDPNCTIVNGEYTGAYIGEVRKESASDLANRFPKHEAFIKEYVRGKMGTEINFTEWWTDKYVFWKLDKKVLAKLKNPHWNYEQETTTTDEYGKQQTKMVPGQNHFKHSKKPYIFLSVFNLGLHPFDDTGLIHQNLKIQEMISKRLRQIDVNADNTNGGSVVSGDYFTKEQAASVGEAKRRGDTVWVPSGDVNAAYRQDVGPPLPSHVYQSLQDYRNELKGNFGVSGSTPGGSRQERTIRGKQISQGHDQDRIGGGIAEYVENFAECVFNWMVQLMYVYYDEPHAASVLGAQKTKEYIELRSADLTKQLRVAVKDGSLLPKDSRSERDEAIQLWNEKAIDPITLFEKLDFPNPREAAKNLYTWMTQPQALFPDMQPPQPQQPPQPPNQPQ